MECIKNHWSTAMLVAAATGLAVPVARADAVTDWNVKAGDFVVDAKLGPPPANRALAIVQTAVYGAANAITRRYPASAQTPQAAPGASVDAAIAAANRVTLAKLLPSQQAAIDAAYEAALWRRSPTARRRRTASRWAARPPRRTWQRAPTTVRQRPRPIDRRPHRVPTCPPPCRPSRNGRSAGPG